MNGEVCVEPCVHQECNWAKGTILGSAGVLRPSTTVEHNRRTRPMEELLAHRAIFITYLRHRIEDEDWHGASDAANDLRELDCEIRMTEAAR